MKVTIDNGSGFCFGVTRAIEAAERELDDNKDLFCLGDIVHNEMEVRRLQSKGLRTLTPEEFEHLNNAKVMIRAHGEPPETYKTAQQNEIRLIDSTCPIVLKLQKRILGADREMALKNGQVVIYGKEGHAEVRGLVGQTGGRAIVVTNEKDLGRIDLSRPIRMFSQTTMNTDGFHEMVSLIEEKLDRARHGGLVDFQWHDTICRQVSGRSEHLRKFAGRFDVIIFVSGKKSSNGLYLYGICRSANPATYFVSAKEDLKKEWFRGAGNAGVCGATSTPKWLMEEIGEEVKKISN